MYSIFDQLGASYGFKEVFNYDYDKYLSNRNSSYL